MEQIDESLFGVYRLAYEQRGRTFGYGAFTVAHTLGIEVNVVHYAVKFVGPNFLHNKP